MYAKGATRKSAFALITMAFAVASLLFLRPASPSLAQSESFTGYNLTSASWATGNLGSLYVEGDWVSYQLVLTSSSKAWGKPFDISWNFYQSSADAVFIDGFKNFQVGAVALPNGQPVPSSGWGTPLTVGTEIVNYQDPYPAGTTETPAIPAGDHRFTVDLPAGLWSGSQIVLFYQAHLTLDIVWFNGLETNLPTALDGDAFEGWTAPHHGSSFATGSSKHFSLRFPGIGGKTVPIPITQYPAAVIKG